MAKTDNISDFIRESLSSPTPLARSAVNRAFKRIRRRKIIYRAACVTLPMACAILILCLLLPKSITPPKDDILKSPSPSPSMQPEFPETGTVYVSEEDPYYHTFDQCACIKGETEPMMERVAKLNILCPCPVCCIFETKQPLVEAMAIGDVVILRYEDEYLYDHELTGVFGFNRPIEYEGKEANSKLSEHLHGRQYLETVSEVCQAGALTLTACSPEVLGLYIYDESSLVSLHERYGQYTHQTHLNSRYLGSSHYELYYPDFSFTDFIDVYGRINAYKLTLTADESTLRLEESFDEQTLEKGERMFIRSVGPESAIFLGTSGNLTYSIHYTGNEYVLIIEEKAADPYLLENVTLRIGDTGYTVNGFMTEDGNWEELKDRSAKYACILTDHEAAYIQNGGNVSIEHIDFSQIASESPFAYTPIQYGTGSYGVMDKNGNFVIAPEYENAWSFQSFSGLGKSSITGPIVLRDYAETLYIYNGDTLEPVTYISLNGENAKDDPLPPSKRNSINAVCASLLELRRDDGNYLINQDGEIIMPFLYDSEGNYENSLFYRADYRHQTIGYPDRIVLIELNGNDKYDRAWLSDLNGNRLSKDYHEIIPFTWSENRALFITILYDLNVSYTHACDYGAPFTIGDPPLEGADDVHFRVGLIDQNGKEILEPNYISLEVFEDYVLLTDPDGIQETVMMWE